MPPKIQLPNRVADYFLVVGVSDAASVAKNRANSGKRRTVNFSLKPDVLFRFPEKDYKDAEFPRDVTMFCYPKGLFFTHEAKEPELFHFILTEADGTRVFGTAFRYYEKLDPVVSSALTRDETKESVLSPSGSTLSVTSATSHGEERTLYCPKALCLTSHWGFYRQFDKFFRQLHSVVQTKEMPFPVERAIANFICETPLPPPGRIMVEWKSLGASLVFKRPPPNHKVLADFDISVLFRCLSVDTLMLVFSAVLTERRMLFITKELYKLTPVMETLNYLICPFFWRHIYIPVLPQRLTDFVCAPMPFMVGVEESYLPDELMLDRVILIHLDNGTVAYPESEPIPPLPEKALGKMQKILRRVIPDFTHPISAKTTLDEKVVSQAFLAFFIKILKHYRDYMEAPSEEVIEKFDKQKFLDRHSDKSVFLEQHLETQMFQCFVDDRYAAGDASASENLEVLFFDESVDGYLGKQTPFLSDTGQVHQEKLRYACLTPNLEGLEKDAKFRYKAFPDLQLPLFQPVREVAPLVSKAELTAATAHTDVSQLSMKFFKEKRLYSQHFHSLRLRSSKQDLLFKDVDRYMRSRLVFDERFAAEFDKLCSTTIDKDFVDTATSIDAAVDSLKAHVSKQGTSESEALRRVRDEAAQPLTQLVNSAEHQLKLLFTEAAELEEKAGRGKAIVEARVLKARSTKNKYNNLRQSLSARILSQSEIARLVAAQATAESARLERDEADTTFRTVLDEYEGRMPEIIKTIRRLNGERISQLKKSLQVVVQSRRQVLQSMLKSLDVMDAAVEDIDADRDVSSFSQGTTDFWAMGRLGSKPHIVQRAVSSPVLQQDQAGEAKEPGETLSPLAEEYVDGGRDPPSLSKPSSDRDNVLEIPEDKELGVEDDDEDSERTAVVEVGRVGADIGATRQAQESVSIQSITPRHGASILKSPGRSRATAQSSAAGLTTPAFFPKRRSQTVDTTPITQAPPKSASNPKMAPVGVLKNSSSFDQSRSVDVYGNSEANTDQAKRSQHPRRGSAKDDNFAVEFRHHKALSGEHTVMLAQQKRNLLNFTVHLWGAKGFIISAQRSDLAKQCIKQFTALLEESARIYEDKSKKLELLSHNTTKSLTGQTKHVSRLWSELLHQTDNYALVYKDVSTTFRRQASNLRLTKGELKQSTKRFLEHKDKLGQELQEAVNLLQRAHDKRARLMSTLEHVKATHGVSVANAKTQREVEQHAARVDAAAKEFKEADHAFILADRNKQAVQNKHDVCLGRLLGLFEEKHRRCSLELQRSLTAVITCIQIRMLDQTAQSDVSLKDVIDRVDIESDLREFVLSNYDRNTPKEARIQPNSKVDFGVHLSHGGWDAAFRHEANGMHAVKSMIAFVEERINVDEYEVKWFQKVKPTLAVYASADPSLGTAFSALNNTFVELISLMEKEVTNSRDIVLGPLVRLRATLKSEHQSHEKQWVEMTRLYEKVLADRDRAVVEEKTKLSAHKQAEDKLAKARAQGNAPQQKVGFFSKMMGSHSVADLEKMEAQAKKDLDAAVALVAERTQMLEETSARRKSELARLLRLMQQEESRRIEALQFTYGNMVDHHRTFHLNLRKHIQDLDLKCSNIDVHRDIQLFIHSNRTQQDPPKPVIQDMERRIREKAEKKLKEERVAQERRIRLTTVNKVQFVDKRSSNLVSANELKEIADDEPSVSLSVPEPQPLVSSVSQGGTPTTTPLQPRADASVTSPSSDRPASEDKQNVSSEQTEVAKPESSNDEDAAGSRRKSNSKVTKSDNSVAHSRTSSPSRSIRSVSSIDGDGRNISPPPEHNRRPSVLAGDLDGPAVDVPIVVGTPVRTPEIADTTDDAAVGDAGLSDLDAVERSLSHEEVLDGVVVAESGAAHVAATGGVPIMGRSVSEDEALNARVVPVVAADEADVAEPAQSSEQSHVLSETVEPAQE